MPFLMTTGPVLPPSPLAGQSRLAAAEIAILVSDVDDDNKTRVSRRYPRIQPIRRRSAEAHMAARSASCAAADMRLLAVLLAPRARALGARQRRRRRSPRGWHGRAGGC